MQCDTDSGCLSHIVFVKKIVKKQNKTKHRTTSTNQSTITFVLRHATSVLTAQDNVLTTCTVKIDPSYQQKVQR